MGGADEVAAACGWYPTGIGKEGESTIIENVCAGGAGDFVGLGDLMNDDCARSGTTDATGGGVAVLGEERPTCDTGVVEGEGRSEFGALGAQSVEDDATAGRPAAASDALNFDVLLRMLGGATGACCGLLTDDDDAPEASAALLDCKELPLGVGRTVWT